MSAESSTLFTHHPRRFESNRFVYPVVSRRAGGMSIGVNLNPDKACNFDCIYCQVDRAVLSETRFVQLDRLLTELDATLEWTVSGQIYHSDPFAGTPPSLRRVNDIAFSGDGEPTTYRNFDEIISACADVKRRRRLDHVKMVLITNASMFHRGTVQRGLAMLDANHGEIWAKLDAGTDGYYRQIDRTPIPLQHVLDNITAAARVRPLVIQSIFMRVRGEAPSRDEQLAYCDRLNEIVAAGGRIKLVQIYSIARPPAESYVAPLTDAEVDQFAELVRERTRLAVAGYYGVV